MGYTPFTNDYTGARTPAFVAAEYARQNAKRALVQGVMQNGNQVMGGLVTECCSDPAYGGQSFFGADTFDSTVNAIAPSTPGSSNGASGTAYGANNPDVAALRNALKDYPITPVDILTGTYGFPRRANGRPWPRPRLPGRFQREFTNGYPNDAAQTILSNLVTPCPCGPSLNPVPPMIPVPIPSPMPNHETVASEQARLAVWRAGLSGLGQSDTPLSGVGGLLAIVVGAGMLWWATRK